VVPKKLRLRAQVGQPSHPRLIDLHGQTWPDTGDQIRLPPNSSEKDIVVIKFRDGKRRGKMKLRRLFLGPLFLKNRLRINPVDCDDDEENNE
jgi:hypothetical protein